MKREKRLLSAAALLSALVMVNIGPAFAFPADPCQAEDESAYKEIKRKFNIDMLKWLKGTLVDLPDSIGNLTLNKPVSNYNLSTWRSKPYQSGLTLWEGDASRGNLWQLLVNDKGTIVTIAYTYQKSSADFVKTVLRYGVERYMKFFLEYYQKGGLDYHLFRQIRRNSGSTRFLFFISGKDYLSIQVGLEKVAAMTEIERNLMNPMSKQFPDVKIEIYKEDLERSLSFNFIVRRQSPDDAYISRILVIAVSFVGLIRELNPDLGNWPQSKVYLLLGDNMPLGWMKADDCATAQEIEDVAARQRFIVDKFHNTLAYLYEKYEKRR